MSLYDVFAICDSEVNVRHMPVTRLRKNKKTGIGIYLRVHHFRDVECLIRDLSKEFVSPCLNKSAVLWNDARCEALPQHTTSVIVSGIVVSKDDGPRGPHPAKVSDVRISIRRQSTRGYGAGMVLTFPSQTVPLDGPNSSALACSTIPLHPRVG